MLRTYIIILTAATACTAESHYIGTASCAGSFWVDSAGVSNHATIFENSIVETEGAPARLQIAGGVRIMLDAHTRAQVHTDRLTLERGRVRMGSGNDYRIEAHGVRVTLGKPQARTIVAIGKSSVLQVAALNAMVHVANAEGVAVANIAAGRAVELRLGQASQRAVLIGCVAKSGGAYTLRDETSAVTVELRGADVANQVGKRVQVTGEMAASQHPSARADEVVEAKAIQVLSSECGTVDQVAMTESRVRSAPEPENAQPPGNAPDAATPSDGSAGSTGASAGSTGTAGSAGTAGTAGAAGAASAGIGVSTAVIAGVAVAAAAGTAAAIVATQNHKPAISQGR